MYKDLKYVIFNNNLGRLDIHDWLKALDPQLLASIRKIELSFPDCHICYFAIYPRKIDEPVTEHPANFSCSQTCSLREAAVKRAEKRVQLKKMMLDLPLVGNGKRREITKETMAAMLKVVGFVVDDEPAELKAGVQTD